MLRTKKKLFDGFMVLMFPKAKNLVYEAYVICDHEINWFLL